MRKISGISLSFTGSNVVLKSLFLFVIFSIALFASSASAIAGNFSFTGYVQNSSNYVYIGTSGTVVVNISAYTVMMGPNNPALLVGSNITNSTGWFNLSVTPADTYNGPFRIVVTEYTNNVATAVTPILPPMPSDMFINVFRGSNASFYITPASTIFIRAFTNESILTRSINFSGMLEDVYFGMPIDSFFPPTIVWNRSIVVPRGRNYSLVLMKQYDQTTQEGGPPMSFDIYDTNLSQYLVFNLTVNMSVTKKYVTGNISFRGGVANGNATDILAYCIAGDKFPTTMPPMQMPEFVQPGAYNPKGNAGSFVNGTFFNISVMGGANAMKFMLVAFGRNGSVGNANTSYFIAFQNITVSNSDLIVNMNLSKAVGNYSVGGTGMPINMSRTNISLVWNNSGAMTAVQQGGFMEIYVTYATDYGSVPVKTMAEPDMGGSVLFPFIQGANVTVKLFNKQFGPQKKKLNLSKEAIQIELKTFDMRAPGSDGQEGAKISGTFIGMYKNNATCNLQNPAPNCQLVNFSDNPDGSDGFNPMKIMSGEKVNIRLIPGSSGVVLYFINVDMMASGPPPANPGTSPDVNQTIGNNFAQIWRFGSMAPEIYDYAYIAVPYDPAQYAEHSNSANITLNLLYDTEWNLLWNISAYANSTAAIDALPSDFTDFLPTYQAYFNISGPALCNQVTSSLCYVDTANNKIWLKIKHFSGNSPYIQGTSPTLNITVVNPVNMTYYNSTNMSINFTIVGTVDKCWVYNTTMHQINFSSCSNQTFNAGSDEGFKNISVYANNSDNTVNATIYFYTDSVRPVISEISPALNATNISISYTNITINITDAYINVSTLTASNIVLRTSGGVQINGTMNITAINSNLTRITLAPYGLLSWNTTYIINISSSIKDNAGNYLALNISNFTTKVNYATTFGEVIGNLSTITTNVNTLNFTVNGTTNTTLPQAQNGTVVVRFFNGTGTLIEFSFVFSNVSTLDLSNVSLTATPNASRGSFLINNLDLKGATKTVFINNISKFSGVCIKDDDALQTIQLMSNNCTLSGEVWVACPGSGSGYTCAYDNNTNRFNISGLSHTAVAQMNDTIPATLSAGTASSITSSTATITLTTGENATCRYSGNANTAYASMSGTTSLGTSHQFDFTSLSASTAYTYYFRCSDAYSNANGADYSVSFTTSASTTTTGGSGGSSGSVAIVASMSWATINAGEEKTATFSTSGIPFTNLIFKSKNLLSNVNIEVEKLSGKPAGISNISGAVYAYIKVSNLHIATSDLNGNMVIKFKVPRTWVAGKNITALDLVLKRHTSIDDKWTELGTVKNSEDSSDYYYTSYSPGFSYFAMAQADASLGASTQTTITNVSSNASSQQTGNQTTTTTSTTAGAEQPIVNQTQETQPSAETTTSPSGPGFFEKISKVNKWWFIGAGLVLVIVIVLLVLFSMKGKRESVRLHRLSLPEHEERHSAVHKAPVEEKKKRSLEELKK